MPRAELLRGSSGAAQMVTAAYREALQGDSTVLDELYQTGSVGAGLCSQMRDTLAVGQGQGSERLEAMEAELATQQATLKVGTPVLSNVRLVVGAHRAGFDGSGMYRLEVGSHLAVVAPHAHSLWNSSVQEHLLETRGCTVQCSVRFEISADEAASAGPPQEYLFEAAVSGAALVDNMDKPRRQLAGVRFGDPPHDADASDELFIALVDIDGTAGSEVFWHAAEELSPLQSFSH